MKVRVKYEWGYARRRFVEDGAIVGDEEVLDVDATELSAETREGLLTIVGLNPWKEEEGDPERSTDEEPDLDLGWVGSPGVWEARFALAGPPGGPREWDEVMGRYIEAHRELYERRRKSEDAELRDLIPGLQKKLTGEDQEASPTGSDDAPVRGRRRRREEVSGLPDPLVLFETGDFEHATPELLREVKDLAERVRGARKERAAEAGVKRREREARERTEREEQRAAEDEQRAEQKRRQAEEKRAWIKQHGSEHLREVFAMGYRCRDLYIRERAALEWPGYEPHLNQHAEWKPLSSPSLEALAEAERVGGKVSWLTRPVVPFAPGGTTDRNDWTPCEAVIIRGYMGKHYVVKEIR